MELQNGPLPVTVISIHKQGISLHLKEWGYPNYPLLFGRLT